MISLQGIISKAANSIGTDVLKIKHGLERLSHYKIPDYGLTEYTDDTMFDGIKSFQEKENLKIDGIIKPDGPTLKRINSRLWDISGKSPIIWCPKCGGPHGGSSGTDICPDCTIKS